VPRKIIIIISICCFKDAFSNQIVCGNLGMVRLSQFGTKIRKKVSEKKRLGYSCANLAYRGTQKRLKLGRRGEADRNLALGIHE